MFNGLSQQLMTSTEIGFKIAKFFQVLAAKTFKSIVILTRYTSKFLKTAVEQQIKKVITVWSTAPIFIT